MKKNYWSKISWLILGLVPLLLIACGGSAIAPTEPAIEEPAPPTAEPAAPAEETVAPVEETSVEEPTVEVMEAVEEVEAEVEDEIVPVSAKPQLIEFYAEW